MTKVAQQVTNNNKGWAESHHLTDSGDASLVSVLPLCRSIRSVCEVCGRANSRSWSSYVTETRNVAASRTPSRRWGTWWTHPATSHWVTPCRWRWTVQHPSIHFQNLLFHPSWCEGRVTHWASRQFIARPLEDKQVISTLMHNYRHLELPIVLICMFMDCGRRSARSHTDTWRTCKLPIDLLGSKPTTFLLRGSSANHCRLPIISAFPSLSLHLILPPGTCRRWRHPTPARTARFAASGEGCWVWMSSAPGCAPSGSGQSA